jgi:hypothetical protein
MYRNSDVAVGDVAGKRISGNDKVNKESESQKIKPANDPDSGKIKSAFGDILDISDKGKAASESLAQSKVESEQDESKSSNVAAKDTRIEVTDTAPKTLEITKDSADESLDKIDELKSENELTAEEKEQVHELKERDAEVRKHEAAHIAVAGQYAQGSAEYTYQTGPDGKKYAIGGSVSIDVSEIEGDPEATIAKMRQVAAAATAPIDPSNQDLKVAAAARQTETKARMELAQKKNEAANSNNTTSESNDKTTTVNKNNTKQNINDKILKSIVTSAYTNQSTLSSNTKNPANKVNVFA